MSPLLIGKTRLAAVAWLIATLLTPDAAAANPAEESQLLMVVDCLLPGQIRQLGQRTTYVSARRPVRTTARDCQIRGGEYTSYDRADLASALAIWLPAAGQGDQEAATIVGEIFEKGVRSAPDFSSAAQWYRRAADLGSTRAQINLGHLYERGLGVARDPNQAILLYRRAAGLDTAIALDSPASKPAATDPAKDAAVVAEQARLRAEIDKQRTEVDRLRRESDSLRELLARSNSELTVARTALETATSSQAARLADLQKSGAALDEQRRIAAEGQATLAKLRADLADRETRAATQTAEADRLREELRKAQTGASEQGEQLARLRAASEITPVKIDPALVAGPEIAIIEPPLLATRDIVAAGMRSASTASREIIGRILAPAGLLRVAVNDEPVTVNDQGVFVATLAQNANESPVRVVAIDRGGKRAALEFRLPQSGKTAGQLTTATGLAEDLSGIDFGRYHALLIGNNEYAHLRDLDTAVDDATEMAEVLRTRYGFQTTVLKDASRYAILKALNDLREKLTTADNLLIYYAGHGELDTVNQRGYWLPVDAEPDSNANWIPSVAITDMLNIMKARQILLVVDSCYAGALTRSSVGRLTTATTPQERHHWLQTMAKKRARTVLTSGGLAPVLDTGGGKHSVFARALLEVLNSNDGLLEGQLLHREVAARVSYAAGGVGFDQVPEYAPIRFAGHEAGEFFLLPQGRVKPTSGD